MTSMTLPDAISTKPGSPVSDARPAMKIARIETFFAPPRWLFVRVEADGGAFGWGEASLEGWARRSTAGSKPSGTGSLAAIRFRMGAIGKLAFPAAFYGAGRVWISA